MLNLNKNTKTKPKPKPTLVFKNCSHVCTTDIHITAQNSYDNLPAYPPNNHHSSDDVFRREGGTIALNNVNQSVTESFS